MFKKKLEEPEVENFFLFSNDLQKKTIFWITIILNY